MVFPVHLQRSAVAAILDCHVWGQFSGPESLKPVALQLIWFFQESLIKYSDLFAPIEATLCPLHGAAAKAALKQLLRVALGFGAAPTELGG